MLLLGVQSLTVFEGVTIACFSFQDCIGVCLYYITSHDSPVAGFKKACGISADDWD